MLVVAPRPTVSFAMAVQYKVYSTRYGMVYCTRYGMVFSVHPLDFLLKLSDNTRVKVIHVDACVYHNHAFYRNKALCKH